MIVVAMWNEHSTPSYLRHFLYTIQLNAEHLDLLFINRRLTPESKCIDFEAAGLNVTWAGNIKHVCIDEAERTRRFVDFMCSAQYGWDCDAPQYEAVAKEFDKDRPDVGNYNWRPLLGLVFRDLFPDPTLPLWGWIDTDVILGNFDHYPFNIASQLSILTGSSELTKHIFMAGQLTVFNDDHESLKTAWKKFPQLRTADHFTQYLQGRMPESMEEAYWSYGYMRSGFNGSDLPGADLSYGVYPDINGDDFYDFEWVWTDEDVMNVNLTQVYVVSGTELLLIDKRYTRQDIEALLHMERAAPVDELSGIGWTAGEDGSEFLVANASLTSTEAKALAITKADAQGREPVPYQGVLESLPIITEGCHWRFRQCIEPGRLAWEPHPLLRLSLLRFKEMQRGHVLGRYERDHRRRGYERKLLRHHLRSKHYPWFELPPFDITEDLVLRYNSEFVEVFRIGGGREETLFWRERPRSAGVTAGGL